MNKTIICIITAAGLLSCPALKAQSKHEFSISGGGGLSSLIYKTEYASGRNDFGTIFGLGYRYLFSPNWGLVTGTEVSLYSSIFRYDAFDINSKAVDSDREEFEFRSSISEYRETQNALFLQIPLMLQFQTGKDNKFYFSFGGKIGLPIGGDYENTVSVIENSGYYSEENYEYQTQEFAGFGKFADRSFNGSLKFKPLFLASVETGVKWKLADGLSMYSGVYMDYGLNSIYAKSSYEQQFVSYNSSSPRDFSINSVLNSQYTKNSVSQPFTDKITPVSVGIKFSLTFGSKTKPTTQLTIDN
jgi:hypothetical protein